MNVKPVLIIEDDPDIRANLKDFLESEGYEVTTAANGREGLDRLRSHPQSLPGVIYLDLMMPVMDGKTFLNELVRDEALVDAGFMKKPLDIDQIVEVTRKYCRFI